MADVPRLRDRAIYAVVRAASVAAARQQAFRIVHLSIQHTHLHLIVEANDKAALARGMQSFQISVTRRINALIEQRGTRRRGRVFSDRYHLVVIRSPTQMRNVLSYVLGNWRKHGADRGTPRAWLIDPFATGFAFDGWKEAGKTLWPATEATSRLVVKAARSWVLTKGWRLGGEVSVYDVPGRRPD